jgi:ABC-type multidrug transport system ATPase subunit
MINVVGVTQHYGIRPILREIHLKIERGEVVALMGPNGMGKSTLLSVMAGVLSPQRGYVEIDGKRRRGSPEEELAIRKQVVYLPDQAWLPQMMTGRDYLLAVGRLYGVEDLRLMDHIERVLKLFSLDQNGDSAIKSYSTGQKKKISLCAALVTETPIMLLDEPFSGGLDPAGIYALKCVLQQLRERDDVTIVMATPVPEIVDELADRIAIIRNGTIAAFDSPAGLRQMTNCQGSLQAVLERLIAPETLEAVEQYIAGRPS